MAFFFESADDPQQPRALWCVLAIVITPRYQHAPYYATGTITESLISQCTHGIEFSGCKLAKASDRPKKEVEKMQRCEIAQKEEKDPASTRSAETTKLSPTHAVTKAVGEVASDRQVTFSA